MAKIKDFNKEHLMEILDLLKKGNTITYTYKSFEKKFNTRIRESTFRNWVNKSFTNTTNAGTNKWICTHPLYSQLDYFTYMDNNISQDTKETSECKSQNTTQQTPQPTLDKNPQNIEGFHDSEKIITTLKGENLTSNPNKEAVKNDNELAILEKNIDGALFKLGVLENKLLSIEKMMKAHIQENDRYKKLMRQIITLVYDEIIKE